MNIQEEKDYGHLGYTIGQAFVQQHLECKKKKIPAPNFVLWRGKIVKIFDKIKLPPHGKITGIVLHDAFSEKKMNGFDLKFENGYLVLEEGEQIKHLRTWSDPDYEDKVEYEFFATPNSILSIWNVSRIYLSNGHILVEKWTGNAGFIIEEITEYHKVYHCNHYEAENADFNDFRFSIEISPPPSLGSAE